ncbi:DNA internalization-related competence protein ComEC/Rec2, partial [Trinickia caryophylli]|uniref:DNA internalization-related competence protein ComEC/Rec2 n=1 Tax=Trinickia caryophylli TaxID=28094 RepID=UPI000C8810C7
ARRLAGGEGGLPSAIDRRRMALAERSDAVLGKAAHRGIVTALAIGAQEAIGAEDRAALRRTGTSHLVAISGLHIGLVAGIAAGVSAWLWRRSCLIGRFLARRSALEWPLVVPVPLVAVLAGTLCAAFYAALAGFNVPAQRAFWMLCVVAAAFALGRNVVPSVVLAWAAALVLLVDPWAVLGPGFWLSFGAVAVISFALQTRMRSARAGELAGACGFDADDMGDGARTDGEWWRRWCLLARRHAATMRERIATACHAQYAVTIGLAPLTAYWFSEVPLLGPAANALAVPWVSALVTPLVIVAVILPAPLDAAAFELAHTLLAPLMRLLQRLAEPAWAQWRIARPSVWAMALAALGVVWVLMPRGWPLRIAAPLAWLPLVWPVPSGPPHGAFRLTALDVGQGSAILVETARHALLFDAGPGPESTHAGERIVAPYLRANGVPVLDAIVVSHGDADHAGGVPAVLADAQVLQLMGGLPPESTLWREARAWGADALRCVAGQRWRWDGVDFSVLWPEAGPLPGKANAQSCVLKVEAAGGRALLTGDIDAAVERRLVARASDALKAEVLIVAHHGSKTSSTELFLDSVKPRIAVFQVGYRNRFGHPHPAVWSRFAARGIELARTDRDGAVRVEVAPHGPTLERHRDTHRRYWMEGRENETNEAGRVPRRSSEPGGSQA